MAESQNKCLTEAKREYSEHMNNQYESVWKHLEYHDSNIVKLVNIYFIFAGVFLARIKDFYTIQYFSAGLVAIVGVVFAILLYRTSDLLTMFKKKIVEIDSEKYKLHKVNDLQSIPPRYFSRWRTSIVAVVSISIFTLGLVVHLLTVSVQVPNPN